MKYLLLTTTILIHLMAASQSPYLSILVKMDSVKRESVNYRISMKMCEMKKTSSRGDWFKHDTSSVDFLKLKQADIICGQYSYIEGTDDYAGSGTKFNMYEFGNQVFAWEKIIVFRITDYSSRGWQPEMYIVLPVKYKSFRTQIDLTGIVYEEGKVIYLKDYNATYEDSKLSISHSFEDDKGEEVKKFPLKFILESK